MTTIRSPDDHARATAARQHGALSHAQARRAGLTQNQIDQRVESGAWRRVALATYVVAGAPDTWRQRAWVAGLVVADHDGLLSHITAAAIHGLIGPSPVPHVTVPYGSATRRGISVVHRSAVPAIDRATKDGLRCTSVSRTLVDLAGMVDGPTYDGIVDDAFCRRLASAASVRAAADRIGRGRRGVGRAREAVATWTGAIVPDSVAEARLVRLLRELGVEEITTQHEVYDESGRFVARLDLAAPEKRRALEYDSVEHHGPNRWARDEPRYQRLRALGWDVESVTKLDLLPGEPRLRQIAQRWAA
jgi:hypothetical protein